MWRVYKAPTLLRRCCGAAERRCRCLAPLPISPHVPLFQEVFRGFPALLVMCAAGDGGLAMLILLSGSGKYPSSLRRRKTTKSRVWLQPAGFSAPTRRRPRVTARRFLLSIDPCVTLISNQSPNFNPRKIQTVRTFPGFKDFKETWRAGIFPVVTTTRSITQDLLEPGLQLFTDSVNLHNLVVSVCTPQVLALML